jgi:hypothetical protein
MAKKTNPEAIRKRMANELIALNRVLREGGVGVFHNPEVLLASANQCKGSGAANWHYEVAELILKVNVPQNTLPQIKKKTMFVIANMDIRGKYDNDDELEDCFTNLAFNIRIEAGEKDNICSWHLDRHITSADDIDPQEAHPLYHFQHGGHAMKEIAESLGKVLLLPAPRVAFPPLDATLAVDFLLSNFAGTAWQKLRDDSTYQTLLRDAQKRYWKPYVERLARWWDPGSTHVEKERTLALWPHLI